MRKSKKIESIGKCIKLERIRQAMSQQELSNKAGIHRDTVSKIEKGIVNTSINNIYKIALALNIHVVDLCK